MTLETNERKWLEDFTGVAVNAEVWETNRQERVNLLQDTAEELEQLKDGIRTGVSQDLELKKTKLGDKVRHKTSTMKTMTGDANEEFDTGHDTSKLKSQSPEVLKAMHKAMEKVVKLSERMRKKLSAQKGPDGRPQYSEDEINHTIMDELWTPLVREGILPENMVPDRYSHVKKTFDGSVKIYKERLDRFTLEKEESADSIVGKLTKGLGVGQTVVDKGGDIIIKMTETIGTAVKAPGLDVTKTIMELSKVTLTGGLKVSESLLKRSAEDAADAIGDIVKAYVTQLAGKEIGELVGKAYDTALSGSKVATYLALGRADDAINSVGDYFKHAFSMLDTDETNGLFEKLGMQVCTAVKGAKVTVKLGEAALKGDAKAMRESFKEAIEVGLEQVKSELEYLRDDEGKRKDESEDDVDSSKESIGDDIDKMKLALKGLTDTREKMEEWEEQQLKPLQEEKDREELQQATQEYQNLLSNGFPPSGGDEVEARRAMDSIDALILQMQKDRFILQTLDSLVSAGLSVGGQFLDAFKAAGLAKDFAKRVVAAAIRARELNEWMNNLKDASQAVSVYAEPIKRRVKDSQIQISQETIQAVMKLAQFIGATAAATGVPQAVTAGKIVEGTAGAMSTGVDLVFKVYSELELKAAWKTYKAALSKPSDRKLARKSMRENPTLAKYTMAYGAMIDRDPIAMEAMRKCGLNDRTLTNPEANCHKVVLFLETKFVDDPVLLKSQPNPQKWYPGPVELSFASWLGFVTAARSQAKLAPTGGAAVDGAFAKLEDDRQALEAVSKSKKQQEQIDALDSMVDTCRELQRALKGFKPVGTDKKPHVTMAEYVGSLEAKTEIEVRQLTVQRSEWTG